MRPNQSSLHRVRLLFWSSCVAFLGPTCWAGVLGGRTVMRVLEQEHADHTTRMARQLVLARIETIAHDGDCRQIFGHEKIDLDMLRRTAQQTAFYDATG